MKAPELWQYIWEKMQKSELKELPEKETSEQVVDNTKVYEELVRSLLAIYCTDTVLQKTMNSLKSKKQLSINLINETPLEEFG